MPSTFKFDKKWLHWKNVIYRCCRRPEMEIISAIEGDWVTSGYCLIRGWIVVLNIRRLSNFQRYSNSIETGLLWCTAGKHEQVNALSTLYCLFTNRLHTHIKITAKCDTTPLQMLAHHIAKREHNNLSFCLKYTPNVQVEHNPLGGVLCNTPCYTV